MNFKDFQLGLYLVCRAIIPEYPAFSHCPTGSHTGSLHLTICLPSIHHSSIYFINPSSIIYPSIYPLIIHSLLFITIHPSFHHHSFTIYHQFICPPSI